MASEEVFDYHDSGLWLVLSHFSSKTFFEQNMLQPLKQWKKVDFTDLVKDVS